MGAFHLMIKEIKLILKRPAIVFFLFALPVFFGLVFSSYQTVVPTNTPIGIVVSKNLSKEKMREILAIARTFSSPHLERSLPVAIDRLQREQYYIVIYVRRFKSFENASYVIYYDDSMTPVASISGEMLTLLQTRLGGVSVEKHPLNEHVSLPEFFFPGVLMMLAIIIGFEVVPDNTLEEKVVLPRLKAYSSLPMNFSIRLLIALSLVLLQAAIAKVSYLYSGVDVGFGWDVIMVLLVSTLYLSLFGLGVVLLFRFQRHAKSFLQIMAGFLIFMSGFLYPVGFFPESLQRVAHLLPTYYSCVMLRAFMFRSVGVDLFSDYLIIILTTTLALAFVDYLLYRTLGEWGTR